MMHNYLEHSEKNKTLEDVFFNRVVEEREEYFPPLEVAAVLWASEVIKDYRRLERKLIELEDKLYD